MNILLHNLSETCRISLFLLYVNIIFQLLILNNLILRIVISTNLC